MEKNKNIVEFTINSILYKKLLEKNYKLPAPPVAIIKATAFLNKKKQFKKLFLNKAGIYGWIDLDSFFCYVGSSVKLHIRPWQHVSVYSKGNKNLKLLLKKKPLDNFVLVIFEILESSNQVTASLLESTENIYLQKYIPQELQLNVLPVAYTNLGYKHTEEIKKTFSLTRKGKKGKKRPDLEGPLNPMYGLTNMLNPFFGKKHAKQNLEKISLAAKLKTGLKSSRGCPVKLENVDSKESYFFVTKTEAANFLGFAKANTVTQYIKKAKLFKNKWLIFPLTKEEYFKALQNKILCDSKV